MKVKVGARRAPPSSNGFQAKMAVSDRETLWREKEALEELTRNISYSTNPDHGAVEARIKQIDELLGADRDAEAKGRKRDRIQARVNTLAAEIKKLVPPMSIQRARPGTPEYNKAITWGVEASKPETVKKCEEYQSLSRSLDPDNPDAGSIEALVSE